MRVNEIFYSLQGEGHYTGTPAVFVRLADCNMKCWFCDTEFHSFKEMSEGDIIAEVLTYPTRYVVITGGEPTLLLTSSLTNLMHRNGLFIMLETNGSRPLPEGCEIDWITCSPKRKSKADSSIAPVRLQHIDELKVVYEGEESAQDMRVYESLIAKEYRLQPCATSDTLANDKIVTETVRYILDHPKWSLSLQTHKLLNIQ